MLCSSFPHHCGVLSDAVLLCLVVAAGMVGRMVAADMVAAGEVAAGKGMSSMEESVAAAVVG